MLPSYRLLTDPSIHSPIISTLNTMKENVFTISRGCILADDELHLLLVLLEPVVKENVGSIAVCCWLERYLSKGRGKVLGLHFCQDL